MCLRGEELGLSHGRTRELTAVLTQVGQGLMVQQEATTNLVQTTQSTFLYAITGVPIPDFGKKATKSPKSLKDIQWYLQAMFSNGCQELRMRMRIT